MKMITESLDELISHQSYLNWQTHSGCSGEYQHSFVLQGLLNIGALEHSDRVKLQVLAFPSGEQRKKETNHKYRKNT